jgi:alkyl hydroperoxide reductase subunit AhpC
VLAISVDSVYSHLAWANQPRKDGGLSPVKIPLVSDIKKTIAADYRVLVNDSVALRGLFIIDGKGIIRQATINDLPIGRSVDETLRLIEAIQFHDKHGEVCPANWKPGSATVYIHPLSAHRSSLNLKAPRPTSSSRTSNTAKPIV